MQELVHRLGLLSARARRTEDKNARFAIYKEMGELYPAIIRGNLEWLGVEDLTVRPAQGEMMGDEGLLSDMAACNGRLSKWRFNGDRVLWVDLMRDGEKVAELDSDSCVHYMGTPDLRTAFGWWIATDGGRCEVIEGIDLDAWTQALLYSAQKENESRFLNILKRMLPFGKISRYGDSHLVAHSNLWYVATWQAHGKDKARKGRTFSV